MRTFPFGPFSLRKNPPVKITRQIVADKIADYLESLNRFNDATLSRFTCPAGAVRQRRNESRGEA